MDFDLFASFIRRLRQRHASNCVSSLREARRAMAAPAAPLALICSHKRTVANGHARETSAACVDGDFAVTSSWDGELRVWREHSDAVASAFGEAAQRVRAYPDAPSAVTAMARVADGYLVSGGVDGTCAVWTRHESREPLHPSHVVAPTSGGSGGDDDAYGDGDDGDAANASSASLASATVSSPDPATPVPEPVEDPEEEGIDGETRELRLAAKVKWRNEEEFRGPYARVGGWFNAADADGIKTDDERVRQKPKRTCTVRAIVPLYPRGGSAGDDDAFAPPPVDAEVEKNGAPRLLALAASAHGGGLVSGVFLVDVEDAFRRTQHLPHPEGVTCCLADQSAADGHDRLVTGCLDGAVRVWRARAFFSSEPEPEPEPVPPRDEATETREAYDARCASIAKTYEDRRREKNATPAFELEATLRGHEGRAVTCLAWLGTHDAFPPPWRAPPPPPREFDNDVTEEEAEAAAAAAAAEAAEAEPPADWPGKDSCLYFVSGGADGSVKMWERRARRKKKLVETEENDGSVANGARGSFAEEGISAKATDETHEWAAESSEHEVSDAPAAPRIARDVMRGPLQSLLEGVGVKSLAVFGGKIVAGLSDGRVCVWGHRVRDASLIPGWTLEKIHPPANRKKSAVVRLHGFGHNMLVCCADGNAHLYA